MKGDFKDQNYMDDQIRRLIYKMRIPDSYGEVFGECRAVFLSKSFAIALANWLEARLDADFTSTGGK